MFERRLQILLIVLAVACSGLVVRAFSLQAVGRAHWTAESKKALSDEREIPTTRGRILDVKGRELAVDQPCIDACVHYYAIAATRDSKWATNSDERKWLSGVARGRLKRRFEDYNERPLAERKTLLAAEAERVKADIETMWHELAVLAGRTDEEMDEQRRQIVRRVETRRRLLWYNKYESAAEAKAEPSWWARLVGGGPVDIDSFDVRVSEERVAHVILPNIAYELRNELARRAGRYPGLTLQEGVVRRYPYDSVACQTIGRTAKVTGPEVKDDPLRADRLARYHDEDTTGREGLEKLFEPQLRGRRGLVSSTDDNADGDASAEVAETPPTPGADVTTTIDIELQRKVEQAFKSVDFFVSKNHPIQPIEMPGAAVVIDLPTGQVRAMASWPTYDLNKFNELYAQLRRDQINRPMSNRATTLDVEPGSTVKPIIGIGAITAGIFGAHDTIPCDGYVYINGQRIKDGRCWTMSGPLKTTHHHIPSDAPLPPGGLTFVDAIQRSCNVFHEELAYKLGIGGVSYWFDKFGLGKPTGVGLPEKSGVLPDDWRGPAAEAVSIACFAGIGEAHVNATPIQMANVAATIARDGVAIQPTLLTTQRHPSVDLGLNKTALAEARAGMIAVVNTRAGTGAQAKLPGVDLLVAAKTGSAQTGAFRIPVRDDGDRPIKNERGRVVYHDIALGTFGHPNPEAPFYRAIGENEEKRPAHGWMIGFAPADRPTVAFAVLVEYGGGGGPAAGSVVRGLLKACMEEGYVR